jgi:NTE family protein
MKNIVFSAGSMGGLAFVGAWKALEEAGLTQSLIGFSGCSIGSIIALLTSIGYTGDELKNMAHSLKYKDLSDFQILNTLNNLGLETGEKIKHLLEKLLERKIGRKKMTFKEHYQITGRKLWINASCVEHDKCYYYSVDSEPDMDIILAVRMSISLPWIMAAVRYKGLTYIDGGFHDPCPVNMFSADDTLVLRVRNDHTTDPDAHEFIQHTSSIIFSAYRRLHHHLSTTLKEYNIIWLDSNIGSISLDVSKKDRKRLVKIGYQTLRTWLKANYTDTTNGNTVCNS